MRIPLLILTLFFTASIQADVYRSVDEDGNVVYTDKPSPDAEKIRIDEIQTIKGDDVEPFVYTPPQRASESISPYEGVQITSPQNNESIRANAGNVNVTVSVTPGLLTGHNVVLHLDGNEVAEGGTEIGLNDVERGTHTLIAVITAPDGREMKRSPPVTFTVQRVSVSGDSSAPVSPTNPPKPPSPGVSPTNPPKPPAP